MNKGRGNHESKHKGNTGSQDIDSWLSIDKGTGKTHFLLDRIRKELGVGKFLFLTFSRAATKEAKDRLSSMDEFKGLSRSVTTIHSLCSRLLGLKKNNIASTKHYNEVLSRLGLPKIVSLRFSGSVEDYSIVSQNLIAYHSLVTTSPSVTRPEPERYQEFAKAWTEYKDERYIYDYSDLLTEGLKILKAQRPEDRPQLRLLCVDEVQDLSTIQWEIVLEIAKSARKSYFAGDDDQCIFNFAGADVDKMISLQDQVQIKRLENSRRVPQEVVKIANSLIKTVNNRIPKTLKPSEAKGKVEKLEDWLAPRVFKNIEKRLESKAPPSVLILARTNYLSKNLEGMVQGHAPDLFKHAEITTIHKSKGKEADIVVLWTKTTNRVMLQSSADEEARLFYVAMTRAKKKLILLRPPEKEFEI